MLKGKKILLGVTASIAAYKSALIVRLLVKSGAIVKVIQTPESLNFITPLTLSTLSNNDVLSEMVNKDDNNWNNHVELALWADMMLIAPLTAKTMSKMVQGNCDSLLIAAYLSAKCPVFFAPAMDLDMYKHQSTVDNINQLKSFNNIHIPASFGFLASGLEGEGRMCEPEEIIVFLNNYLSKKTILKGKNILITSGPTREAIDKVRYISNNSSGKMGAALVRAAIDYGAKVTLITGPTNQKIHHDRLTIVNVTSADEMLSAVKDNYLQNEIIIFAAAVSDFTPENVVNSKIKTKSINLDLKPTVDIAKYISEIKSDNQFLVGFALENDNELENAKNKLINKKLDLIVLNSLNDEGAGFDFDTNQVKIIDKKLNISKFKLKSKKDIAIDIFNKILELN
tara:strand:+ start:31609 stop:32799 length:1191 start_codon:yes stop_codon:yes gene_type:complete